MEMLGDLRTQQEKPSHHTEPPVPQLLNQEPGTCSERPAPSCTAQRPKHCFGRQTLGDTVRTYAQGTLRTSRDHQGDPS